jgi:hypothetical protein
MVPSAHPDRGHQGSVSQTNLPEGFADRADLDVTHVVVVDSVVDVDIFQSTVPLSTRKHCYVSEILRLTSLSIYFA